MSVVLSTDGTDLVVTATLKDNTGTGIPDLHSVLANIERISDNQWLEGGSFSVGAEPGSFELTLVHIDDGLYRVTSTGNYDLSSNLYQLHLQIIGPTINNDTATYEAIQGNAGSVIITDIETAMNNVLDAANSALSSVPSVETGSLREMIQISAYILKLAKSESLTVQTLFDESGASFATRTINIASGLVTIGKLV